MKDWKDIYKLPLRLEPWYWIYDANENFVFEFRIESVRSMANILNAINGTHLLQNEDLKFRHDNGYIVETNSNEEVILIRGWGNLTGTGGHHLSEEDAINVQDTFAEFIVEQLNKRDYVPNTENKHSQERQESD